MRNLTEISQHDQLVLMMAEYFLRLGYTNIKADIRGWEKPDSIFWSNNPNNVFYPDLTCVDNNGRIIILEAETCSTLNDQHTKNQFAIFRAHANNNNGLFHVVVPRFCNGGGGRDVISRIATSWSITIDTIWVPST